MNISIKKSLKVLTKKDIKYNNIYLTGRDEKRMGSNLNDHQVNIDCYMQKRLYTSLMLTIYQTTNKYTKNKEKEIQIYH